MKINICSKTITTWCTVSFMNTTSASAKRKKYASWNSLSITANHQNKTTAATWNSPSITANHQNKTTAPPWNSPVYHGKSPKQNNCSTVEFSCLSRQITKTKQLQQRGILRLSPQITKTTAVTWNFPSITSDHQNNCSNNTAHHMSETLASADTNWNCWIDRTTSCLVENSITIIITTTAEPLYHWNATGRSKRIARNLNGCLCWTLVYAGRWF